MNRCELISKAKVTISVCCCEATSSPALITKELPKSVDVFLPPVRILELCLWPPVSADTTPASHDCR